MRIGMLTGGGDVPGLNVAIKTVVDLASRRGWEVVGIRRGWEGLVRYAADGAAADGWASVLTPGHVRTIDRTGGTILHTTRIDPDRMKPEELPPSLRGPGPSALMDVTPAVLRSIGALKLDALIAVGGDGTLAYGARLAREGVPIVTMPKTMDNDVWGTDLCIGFSTAVTRSVEAITALRTTPGSHERVLIVELFGRRSGETAFLSGLLADADRTVIAEIPANVATLAEQVAADYSANPSRYAVVVVAEGATLEGRDVVEQGDADVHGRRRLGGIGEVVGAEIRARTGLEPIVQRLAYMMRSGPPDSFDRLLATSLATLAVELVDARRFGMFCAVQGGRYVAIPADEPGKGRRQLDAARLYDAVQHRPRIGAIEGMPLFLS